MSFSWRRGAKRSGEGGFTLIELMVVLAIICLLLAILIGPVQRAIQKGRFVKTSGDIRTVGLAWCEKFGGSYANCGPGVAQPTDVPAGDFPLVLDALGRLDLEGLLGVTLPQYDTWGEEIEYRVDNWPGATRLMIRSRNGNRLWDDGSPYQWQTLFPFTDQDTDLVWVNCHWVQY